MSGFEVQKINDGYAVLAVIPVIAGFRTKQMADALVKSLDSEIESALKAARDNDL